jgi:hypothetical protein
MCVKQQLAQHKNQESEAIYRITKGAAPAPVPGTPLHILSPSPRGTSHIPATCTFHLRPPHSSQLLPD